VIWINVHAPSVPSVWQSTIPPPIPHVQNVPIFYHTVRPDPPLYKRDDHLGFDHEKYHDTSAPLRSISFLEIDASIERIAREPRGWEGHHDVDLFFVVVVAVVVASLDVDPIDEGSSANDSVSVVVLLGLICDAFLTVRYQRPKEYSGCWNLSWIVLVGWILKTVSFLVMTLDDLLTIVQRLPFFSFQ
jgi:hypothetical protein